MAEIIIEKRVSLDHLGDKHKDSYITFKAMSVRKYTELIAKIGKTKTNEENITLMVEALSEHFVEGNFAEQVMSKEDIEQFDPDNVMLFFQTLTGQKTGEDGEATIDPKDESSSTKQSSTEPKAPQS